MDIDIGRDNIQSITSPVNGTSVRKPRAIAHFPVSSTKKSFECKR
jgi:hypothetical protein